MVEECGTLTGIHRADAAIVGAGLTGLTVGAALSRAGMRVIVLDRGCPGLGTTALCGGLASLLGAPAYGRIHQMHGEDAARQHADTLRALLAALPAQLAGVPFRETEAYVYAFLPRDLAALESQRALYAQLGIPALPAPDAGGCPFPVELSLRLSGQLLVNVPALLERCMLQIRQAGGMVCGDSSVLALSGGHVYTAQGRVDAPSALLCTGKPLALCSHGALALMESRTLVQQRLTGPLPLHTCQQSVRDGGLTLQPVAGGMAASFQLGRSGSAAEGHRMGLYERILSSRLPDLTGDAPRFRQEIWPLDGLPVIGALPGYGGHVLCATALAGQGLLGAQLAAQVLTRHLLGRVQRSDRLYAPDRLLPRRALQQAVHRLFLMRAASSRRLRSPRCTLCSSRLRYHAASERWACAVCGSTFGILGQLMTGPAMLDADISPLQRPRA